jgi:hypothetical protein
MRIERHDPKGVVQKFGDEGTTTPFIARLMLGVMHIRDAAYEDTAGRLRFDELYEPVLSGLRDAREARKEIEKSWKDHQAGVEFGTIARVQHGTIYVDDNVDRSLGRSDTSIVGRAAEQLAASLLKEHGYNVRDLNAVRANNPLYDLVAITGRSEVAVSVKCARAKRELRLGSPKMLKQLRDDCVVMAFLPPRKGSEIQFSPKGYELLIIPGHVARDEALAAHNHYAATHPSSASHSVMVKDKVDRNEFTRSGAVFKSWHERYLNAWDTFDVAFRRSRRNRVEE